MTQSFRTREVTELYDSIAQWSHPEYPFLDKEYSPNSNAPATDYTLPIANWLHDGRIDALKELWFYIASSGVASERMLVNGIRATIPQQLGLPSRVQSELRAIFLMTLRTQFIHFQFYTGIAIELAASVLACHPAMLVRSGDQVATGPPNVATSLLNQEPPMVRLVVYRATSRILGTLDG